MPGMRRREFITLLGGAAVHGRSRRARSSARCRDRFLMPDRTTRMRRLRAFRKGLKDTGYVEGQNVAVEYRWAEDKSTGCRRSRRNWFVARPTSSRAWTSTRRRCNRDRTIPIVFASSRTRSGEGLFLVSPGPAVT